MPFYIIKMEPEGFVVMNSDDRLSPVLAYSDTGSLNLDDVPGNAFRALLKGSMERNFRKVMKISTPISPIDIFQPSKEVQNAKEWSQLTEPGRAEDLPLEYGMGGVTNGPFLTTTWNQCNHYNELCPEDSGATAYYDGHVAVGCVAVVGAQIMNYYEWPYRGAGSHSYTDGDGSMTGSHNVDFSDSIDWANMQDDYDARGSEPQAAVDAVSELMYEVGVAVEMDYEHGGSSSSTSDLNDMMNQAFLYEKGAYFYGINASSNVADLIRANMLADRPASVSISGHAIVADGHVDDGSNEYFHFNYGWGGSNNGWYLIDDIAGDPAVGCVADLYPAMIPVNVTESGTTNSSPDVPIEWILASVRTAEVQSVSVLSHVLISSTFTDSADDFSKFEITSTSDYKDWSISSSGYSGDCFYKQPGGYSNREYHLTSIENFIPSAGTQLGFRLKARLGTDRFRVMISDNDGQSWSEEYSLTDYDNSGLTWQWVDVNLAAYAGSEILIRFEYMSGSFYPSGGVWLDEIEVSSGSWYDWDTLQTFSNLTSGVVSGLNNGTNTLALQAYDGSDYGARSPSFTVIVESSDADGDGIPNDWETLYYGGPTNANPSAIASNGINTILEAYVAGLNPTNPASIFELSNDWNILQWDAVTGRVYRIYWTPNLLSSFQALETNYTGSFTDTVHGADQKGFYKIDVELIP